LMCTLTSCSSLLSSLRLKSPSAFSFFLYRYSDPRALHSFPTRRSSDLEKLNIENPDLDEHMAEILESEDLDEDQQKKLAYLRIRSEEHTSELQSRENLVCRLLLEKKKRNDAVSD